MPAIDISGKTYGHLRVIARSGNDNSGAALWRCQCVCGETRNISGPALRAGRHQSCGCLSPRFTTERTTTHGASRTRAYRIWLKMLERCSEKATGKCRRLYYERGIRVCDRWKCFENFLADMGHPPSKYTLDRINGNGNYEPNNCRWATAKQQGNNRRGNLVLEHNGLRMTASEWADFLGVSANTIVYRIRRGWSVCDALTRKIQKRTYSNETIQKLVA